MKRLDAYKVYLIFSASSWVLLLLVSPLVHVYYVRMAGLTPLELGVAGAIMAATTFLFEVPTGVVADAFSRRLSVIAGVFLSGAAYLWQGLLPAFAPIAIGQAVLGIGQTFISGAATAWVADEVGEERVSEVLIRGAQFQQIGGIAGTLSSVALGSIALNLPIVVAGALFLVLSVFLVLFMPERRFKPAPREARTTWQTTPGASPPRSGGHDVRDTFRASLNLARANGLLMMILAVGGVYGFATEGLDRLWEAHFLAHFEFPARQQPALGSLDPVAWFGVFNVGAMFISAISVSIAARRARSIDARSAARALSALNTLFILAMAMLGLAAGFWMALAGFWSMVFVTSVSRPIYDIWLNQNVRSEVRATLLSMSSQIMALGSLFGGVALGALANAFTTRTAMIAIGLALVPALILFARAARREAPRRSPLEPEPSHT